MIIEEALYAHLNTYANLTALVGNRIYPLVLPQKGSYPAITYQKVSGPRLHALQTDPGTAHPRFQISCWAQTYSKAKAVVKQVQAALQDFSGIMGGAGGVQVDAVLFENEFDLYEEETEGKTGLYHIPVDFIIWHQE
ncbi:MAG: DUF3168 domain-containing protein [Clostridia bacterium]|nr:DUF3168 domain-containing protein [Clostridia bacterium]